MKWLLISLLFLMTQSWRVVISEHKKPNLCHISVKHADVSRIKSKLVQVTCHPGYSTSTGQDQILVFCKKRLKHVSLNLCQAKTKHHHPYPLFQSDDPNAGDKIILLDNDDPGAKEMGAYAVDDYDDYAEYHDNGKGKKDYGDYYDYDYERSRDKPDNADYDEYDEETDYDDERSSDHEKTKEEVKEEFDNTIVKSEDSGREDNVDEKDIINEILDEYIEHDHSEDVLEKNAEDEAYDKSESNEHHDHDQENHNLEHELDHEDAFEEEYNQNENVHDTLDEKSNQDVKFEEEIAHNKNGEDIYEHPEEENNEEEHKDITDENNFAEEDSNNDDLEENTRNEEEEQNATSEDSGSVNQEEEVKVSDTYETKDYDDEYYDQDRSSSSSTTTTPKPSEEYDDYNYDNEEDTEDVSEKTVDNEADLIYRNYEILSDFYKKHFVDLRVLDASCEPSRVPPPKVEHGFVKEFLSTQNVLLPGQSYHEIIYQCDPGYKLSETSLGHMFCQQQGWMGVEPYCELDPQAPILVTSHANKAEEIQFDECEDDQGCEFKCKMMDGEPICICQDGYRIQDVTSCIDIDECIDNNGGCEYSCINKPGTFQCECPLGYTADNLRCIDENECVSNNGHGPCQDTCTNTEGSFECSCKGLPGTILASDGKSCEEIDLCKENNGGCSHDCHTSYGQSFCMCPTGMKLDIDWKTCISIAPEVSSTKTCTDGYILSADMLECIDVNECETSPCGNNGYCVNQVPGYRCDCFNGYIFDAITCIDANECLNQPCVNGICINTEGGYNCQCHPGYKLDASGNCMDINECIQGDPCNGGDCINLDGSFECECKSGYRKEENGSCIDIDECKESVDTCGKGAYCMNKEGSFECVCKKEDKMYDTEQRKCKRAKCPPNACTSNGQCILEDTEYKCVCKPGYEGPRCEQDIDECNAPNNSCDQICINTEGSFHCQCHPGYTWDSSTSKCIDVNECEMIGTCENGFCSNTEGSFKCDCNEGYTLNVMTGKCEPMKCIHKCSHACGSEGICICPPGYILKNDVKCVKEKAKKKKPKKKKIDGCSAYNDSTTAIKLTYSKDLNVDTNLYPKNTVVKGRCLDGYKSSGKLKKKCKKDGLWHGNDLNCTLITCPKIVNLEPGVIVRPESCSLEDSINKQKCQYSCQDPNFKLIGTKVSRCKKSGMWKEKGGPPKCVEKRKKKKKSPKSEKSLVHPLSTISVPDTSPFSTTTTTTTTTATTTTETTTTQSTTRPPWPSTTPWFVIDKPTKKPFKPIMTAKPEITVWKSPLPVNPGPQFPSPFIYCPPDVVKDLPSISPNTSSPTVFVRIPQPKTNVNWYDYVKSFPPWAKTLEAELGLGKTLVTFTATSPVSPEVASCSFSIHVRDIIPPRVYNCPHDFDVYLDEGQIEKKVYWDEPIFADNVKIAHVMASKLPGYKMKAGKHDVLYQAADADGNKARCVFTVTVWDSSRVIEQQRSWVLCRVGSAGRQIKLYLSYVPLGCEKLT